MQEEQCILEFFYSYPFRVPSTNFRGRAWGLITVGDTGFQ